MNARKSLYFILPLIALVLMACGIGPIQINHTQVDGSGNAKTEERKVGDIERVSLEGEGALEIIQGNEESLTIEADDNILAYIETNMRGRELVIRIKDGIDVDERTPIRYTLAVKTLNKVSVSGSGDVNIQELQTGDFEVGISGSGDIHLGDLQAEDLQVNISGSGNLDLAGKVQTQKLNITGSGNYMAGGLASQRTEISISGSGNVTVWSADELDIRVSGFGNVSYYGSPSVSQTITGAGEVKSLGDPE